MKTVLRLFITIFVFDSFQCKNKEKIFPRKSSSELGRPSRESDKVTSLSNYPYFIDCIDDTPELKFLVNKYNSLVKEKKSLEFVKKDVKKLNIRYKILSSKSKKIPNIYIVIHKCLTEYPL